MRAIKYLNTTTSAYALYNKGVSDAVYTKDTLIKKNEKKMENYLVVPNNCILSLSLVEQAKIKHFFFSRTRARSVS